MDVVLSVGDWVSFEMSGLRASGMVVKVYPELELRKDPSDAHYAVRLDDQFAGLGHNCSGTVEDGYGWYVYSYAIRDFEIADTGCAAVIEDSKLELILNG